MSIATRRSSNYATLVRDTLHKRGHATNAELLAELRHVHPELSATTVHRITQRLLEDGECVKAPVSESGEMRYDSNLLPHDHFVCSCCQQLRDISLPRIVRNQIQAALDGCRLDGQLLIVGSCHACCKSE